MAETLVKQMIQATGLPERLIEAELQQRFLEKNIEPEAATLDQLRDVISDYLQDVLVELKAKFSTHEN